MTQVREAKYFCYFLLFVLAIVAIFPLQWMLPFERLPDGQKLAQSCNYFKASNITVSGTKLYVNGRNFFVQGVGYSPTPPGTNVNDFFTKDYRYLYKRDLPLIRAMGVNVIRLWQWDFQLDHTDFLDTLWNDGHDPIYALIPFMWSTQIYEDIDDSATQMQVLVDFAAFINQHKYHPAVFGYLIGNELNQEYTTDDLEQVFVLLNKMVKIRDQLGDQHPITMPLADVDFSSILDKYYDYTSIEFWSIQSYSRNFSNVIYTYYSHSSNRKMSYKPLLVSEFGADAYTSVQYQADTLQDMWSVIQLWGKNTTIGGSIMEYCDEWWKGNVPDFQNADCPDERLNHQSPCGTLVEGNEQTGTYLHEEYLGIFKQQKMQHTILGREVALGPFCISPRSTYFSVSSMYGGSAEKALDKKHCADFLPVPWWIMIAVYGFVLLFLFLAAYYFYKNEKDVEPQPHRPPPVTSLQNTASYRRSEYGAGYEKLNESQVAAEDYVFSTRFRQQMHDEVASLVTKAFSEFEGLSVTEHSGTSSSSSDFNGDGEDLVDAEAALEYEGITLGQDFTTARLRLIRLIWDRVLAAPASLLTKLRDGIDQLPKGSSDRKARKAELRKLMLRVGVEMVYVRWMEAYHVWKKYQEGHVEVLPQNARVEHLLRELCLWSVVYQWAGTINHAPERICQVYDYVKSVYFTSNRVSPRQLHTFLFEIFQDDALSLLPPAKRVLNKCTPKGETQTLAKALQESIRLASDGPSEALTFDDLNEHGMKSQAPPMSDSSSVGLDSNVFQQRKKFYRNRGGMIGLFALFFWLLRLTIWVNLFCWYFQPTSRVCVGVFMFWLSVVDSAAKLLQSLAYLVITFQSPYFREHVFAFLWAVLLFVGVVLQTFWWNFHEDAESFKTVWYILVTACTVCFHLLRNWINYATRTMPSSLSSFVSFFFGHSGPFPLPGRLKRLASFDIRDILWTFVFYFLTFALYTGFCYLVLVPSMLGLTPAALCDCPLKQSIFSIQTQYLCTTTTKAICIVGVSLTWLAAALVGLVAWNASFLLILLLTGIVGAKTERIGSVTDWTSVIKHFHAIKVKCFPAISQSLRWKYHSDQCWAKFVDSLYDDYLLTKEEKHQLLEGGRVGFLSPNSKPANAEAVRRIVNFLGSLESIFTKTRRLDQDSYDSNHRVLTMPSWTVIVPIYNETIAYSLTDLLRPPIDSPKRISTLEFLVATYHDEWVNFARSQDWSPSDLLEGFISEDPQILKDAIAEHIIVWASLHGQTLMRTIKGLCNYREALRALARWEEGDDEVEVENVVNSKFQILVTHQTYVPEELMDRGEEEVMEPSERQKRIDDRAALKVLRKYFPEFDLVVNHEHDGIFESVLYSHDSSDIRRIRRITSLKRDRLVGEGKAENQMQALQFALNDVIQVNDMNQYNTLEQSLKLPLLLQMYFKTKESAYLDCWEALSSNTHWNTSKVIPNYRVVGFPEHTYTSNVSLVGELMGAAEFSFVTIFQRVLAYPLKVRGHYGHPDLLDGFWVRNRGGPSKSSKQINVNEDIFTSFDIFARGEEIAYVEWVQAQKGRETGFRSACKFESKLAQGAAQQLRSPHVYHLSRRLPALRNMSLFFGSWGFYVMNLLMELSITCYLYGILSFSVAQVTYHQLGLLGAVIAIPWLLQIGFVQAFPMLVEFVLEQGLKMGVVNFIRLLPMSFIFFIFHMRTKSYYFSRGLLRNQGAYVGTGRGLDLDRMNMREMYQDFASSHFLRACKLLVAVILYCVVTTDSASTAFVRLSSILLVVFSWLLAPVVFNPYPNVVHVYDDINVMNRWTSLYCMMRDVVDAPKSVEDKLARQKHVSLQSWQGWNWQRTLSQYEGKTLPQMMVQLAIDVCLRNFDYALFALLAYELFVVDALVFVALIVVASVFFGAVTRLIRHNVAGLLKLTIILVIPVSAWYFFESGITFTQMLVSMLFCVLVLFVLEEVTRGICAIYIVRKHEQARKKMAMESHHEKTPLLKRRTRKSIVQRSAFIRFFMFVARMLGPLQEIYPWLMLLILSIGNFLTLFMSQIITAVIFNARVAEAWKRMFERKFCLRSCTCLRTLKHKYKKNQNPQALRNTQTHRKRERGRYREREGVHMLTRERENCETYKVCAENTFDMHPMEKPKEVTQLRPIHGSFPESIQGEDFKSLNSRVEEYTVSDDGFSNSEEYSI